jgi:DDB1- and CUL4-associated factor 6
MSGSDDGVLFICIPPNYITYSIGDQETTGIVQLLNADTSVTNVMTGHPYYPILAASGIDHTVKIFSPEGLGPGLRSRQALRDEYKIRSRNDINRQSGLRGTLITRDMLEALALNLRTGRRARGEHTDGPPEGCETM